MPCACLVIEWYLLGALRICAHEKQEAAPVRPVDALKDDREDVETLDACTEQDDREIV